MTLLSEYLRNPLSNISVNTRQRDHTTLVRGAASQENARPQSEHADTHAHHARLTRLLARYAGLKAA